MPSGTRYKRYETEVIEFHVLNFFFSVCIQIHVQISHLKILGYTYLPYYLFKNVSMILCLLDRASS